MASNKKPAVAKKDITVAPATDEQEAAMIDAAAEGLPVPEPEVQVQEVQEEAAEVAEVETQEPAEKPSLVVRAGTDTHFIPKHINIPGVQDAPVGPMVLKKKIKKNTTNPSELAFPTDRWGLTKDVKAALVSMTARICGSPEKYELAKETLDTLLAYLDARYEFDKAARGA